MAMRASTTTLGEARGPAVKRAILLVLCLLAAGLPWSAMAQNGAQMPTQDLLVRQFQAIAFSNEHGGAHRFGRLIRWTDPIQVEVSGPNASAYMPEVNRHLAKLRGLTALPIEVIGAWAPWKRANLEIVFTTGAYDAQAACRTEIRDRNYRIVHARVFIHGPNPALRRHCIAEELTQAMGLADDSQLIADSIFDDDSRAQQLWPWDELMVLTLYDRRLRPGMSVSQAMPYVRMVVSERYNQYIMTHN